MRIPERVVGFVLLDGEKIPVELDKECFELRLYQPKPQDLMVTITQGLEAFCVDTKEHKWIDKLILEGNTSEGYHIFLGTSDKPANYNGYKTYSIDWYYITDKEIGDVIQVRFSGQDVNRFYNPGRAFQEKIKYRKSEYVSVEAIKVETNVCTPLDCGKYSFNDNQITVSCNCYATIHHDSITPLEAESFLKLSLSKQVTLDELVELAQNVRYLLKYVSYRMNADVAVISTYRQYKDTMTTMCGILAIKPDEEEMDIKKASTRIIKAEFLNEHISDLLSLIKEQKLPFGHYCQSIKGRSSYSTSRIIMIMAAIEREFREVYGQDVNRSNNYLNTKEEVLQLLEGLASTKSGNCRKYVNNFIKGIRNSDSSYGANFKYALNDCKSIMEPFVTRSFEGTYAEIIGEVSERVNTLRNGIAHSRLDFVMEACNMEDIKFAEEMLYVIRLKKLGLDDQTIRRAIDDLFDEKMGF